MKMPKKKTNILTPYPLNLKKKFFENVRAYLIYRGKVEQLEKKKKLPFWAPSGAKVVSDNQKVKALSREVKEEALFKKRKYGNNLWEQERYLGQKS